MRNFRIGFSLVLIMTLSACFPNDKRETSTPRPTLTPKEIQSLLSSDCGEFINPGFSPDEDWVAAECSEHGMAVSNTSDRSRSWFFSYLNIYGAKYDNGNAFGQVQPKHWSQDGRYLYFVPFFYGDGGCAIYYQAQGLFRLDLSSRKYTELLAPDENGFTYNISFSGDDKYLGYIETWTEHPILVLNDLVTQTRMEIPLGNQYSGAGNFVWSQDHTQALFSARSGKDCLDMTYYLVLLNMNDFEQKVILEGKWTEPYKPIEWTDATRITVAEWFSGTIHTLDLMTGDLQPITGTQP